MFFNRFWKFSCSLLFISQKNQTPTVLMWFPLTFSMLVFIGIVNSVCNKVLKVLSSNFLNLMRN